MPVQSKPFALALAGAFMLALLLAGCGTTGGGGEVRAATVEALSTTLASTAVAQVQATGTAKATVAVPTATQSNDELLNDAQTQAAAQAADLAAQAATSTAVAPILAELATYGQDPTQGLLAWVHPPVSLDIQGFRQYTYTNQYRATVVGDFAVATDITWNTRFGDSGCGLVLRSDGNQAGLNQYLVIATRAANGHVIFSIMQNGEVLENKDLYARGIDPKFSSENDTTNRLAVVGRGPTFTIFANGTNIGQIVDDKFTRGFVALVALNESGSTHCAFNNTWLWLYN